MDIQSRFTTNLDQLLTIIAESDRKFCPYSTAAAMRVIAKVPVGTEKGLLASSINLFDLVTGNGKPTATTDNWQISHDRWTEPSLEITNGFIGFKPVVTNGKAYKRHGFGYNRSNKFGRISFSPLLTVEVGAPLFGFLPLSRIQRLQPMRSPNPPSLQSARAIAALDA